MTRFPFAPRLTWRCLAAVLALVATRPSVWAANLIGSYDLAAGSYANSISGSGSLGSLSPISTSGTYGFVTSGSDPGWSWSGATAPGTGLTLSGLPINDVGSSFGSYSIGMRFSLGQVSGYRRLIQFQDADIGQYVFDGAFRFYDNGNNPSGGSITANTTVDFVLTRTTTGTVTGYVNGSSIPVLSFLDGSDARTDSNRTLQFFRDNTGGSDFSTSGNVSLLRVWNGLLTAAEIPTAMTIVPEPTTAVLVTVGAAGAMLRRSRRRTRGR